jgi:hypothetical protein
LDPVTNYHASTTVTTLSLACFPGYATTQLRADDGFEDRCPRVPSVSHFQPRLLLAANAGLVLRSWAADLISSNGLPIIFSDELECFARGVLAAGEQERRSTQECRRAGIPIPLEVWQALLDLSSQLSLIKPAASTSVI